MEERRRRAVHVGSGHGKGCAGWLAGRGEEGGTHADPKLGSMPRAPTRKGAGPRATEHTEDRSHSWLLAAAAAHAAVPKARDPVVERSVPPHANECLPRRSLP